uniref:G-protein coupled receptors family 1 profile domain-containing protein n=1 Tax=Phocoena sinus TaxID=42100 RepID=A0A8C9BKY8_PHOSS
MEKENATLLTEFFFSGFSYQQEWQIPWFLVFLVIYLITIVGNLGLIALIWNDSQLHTRMYLFLGSLAFVDTSVSSIVTPKMLVNFSSKSKMIFLSEFCKIKRSVVCKSYSNVLLTTRGFKCILSKLK